MNFAATGLKNDLNYKLLFFLALASVLCGGPFLWAARIGWILLALIFMQRLNYAVYAAFFFSAFFVSAGFMADFIFTLKHFHIGIFILGVIRYLRGELWNDLKLALKLLPIYALLGGILAIGVLNYFLLEKDIKQLRVIGNLSLVLLLVNYLSAVVIGQVRQEGKQILIRALGFFVLGAAVQVCVGFVNLIYDRNLWNLKLIHNNHLGLLCLLTIFHALILYISHTAQFFRKTYFVLAAIVFCGLIASCSRTSWVGAVAGFVVVISMLLIKFRPYLSQGMIHIRKRTLITLFLVAVIGLSFLNQPILNRVKQIKEILQPASWIYTFGKIQSKNQVIEVGDRRYRIVPYELGYYFDFLLEEPVDEQLINVVQGDEQGKRWYVVETNSREKFVEIEHFRGERVIHDLKSGIRSVHRERKLIRLETGSEANKSRYRFECFHINIDPNQGIHCEGSLQIENLETQKQRVIEGDWVKVGTDGSVEAKQGKRIYQEEPVEAFALREIHLISHYEVTEYAKKNPLHTVALEGLSYEIHEYGDEFVLKAHNFGFLGHFRLVQYKELLQILKKHLFFGVGFLHRVVDFHGFYFMVLGATGLLGLLLLLLFNGNLLCRVWGVMQSPRCADFHIIGLSTLCTILAWCIISITETFFLQFAVWINVAVVSVLSYFCSEEESF